MEAEFTRLALVIEADAAKREAIGKEVKEVNRIFRAIQFTLHGVHNVCNDRNGILSICQTARAQFSELTPIWNRIFTDILHSDNGIEKYRAHWRFASEQLVFLAAFTYWLETHQLITIDQTAQMIGVGSNPIYDVSSSPSSTSSTGVGLDLDDYLQGLTALPKELTRLCINCVRMGNYTLPHEISKFIADLYSGFRLLNLKNDGLRRKFDAIKYDVAKVEEVMYDCVVRGLGSSKSTTATNEDAKAPADAVTPMQQ